MTQAFHLLTGEYPPQSGGVGDYTRLVAAGIASRGVDVHVWCPSITAGTEAGVESHLLPDHFGPRSRHALEDALRETPGCLLLQYVPNALGARGANLPFCLWLLRMRRRGMDVRVMFHEPYFYFGWQRPSRNALAVVQRVMAAVLLRASPVAYISTSAWGPYLRPWGANVLVESPIPATVAETAAQADIDRWRLQFQDGDPQAHVVGHFGTFGDHLATELTAVVPSILDAAPSARFVFVGRGADAFVSDLSRRHATLAPRMRATGALTPGDVAAALGACDLVVQPYPDGVTTRRTSVMAALANGVPVVTTDGLLTEPVWRDERAAALAPAGVPHLLAGAVTDLLRDAVARTALAARGRRVYDERFALAHTIDALLGAGVAA